MRQSKSQKSNKKVKPTYNTSKKTGSRQVMADEEAVDSLEKGINSKKGNFKTKSNPFSWYDKFPQLIKDVGQYTFATPLGNKLNLNGPVSYPFSNTIAEPAIMRLNYIPTIGYSADKTSPINRSALRCYSYLRSKIRTANNYDSQDFMMGLMGIDSLHNFYEMGKRIYGVAQLWTPMNLAYPELLLKSMGIQPSTVVYNLAEVRAWLNMFGLNISRFCAPKNIEIFARHKWMNEGLYVDSDNSRAQTYVFVPEGFWKYNNTAAQGGQLDWVPLKSNWNKLLTWDEFTAIGESLLEALAGDNDMDDIAGDVYNAWGINGILTVQEIPENYRVLPSYDKTVMSQIENATFVGGWSSQYTPVISQNPTVNNGAILFTPEFQINGNTHLHSNASHRYILENRLINMHMETVTPEEYIEATRLAVMCDDVPNDKGGFSPTVFGADVLTCMQVGYVTVSEATPETDDPYSVGMVNAIDFPNNATFNAATVWAALQDITQLAHFDWCPDLAYYVYVNDTAKYQRTLGSRDIDNVTVVNFDALKQVHEVCMLSLFDIPDMGYAYSGSAGGSADSTFTKFNK